MASSKTTDSAKSESSKRWAALDSRLERLALAADRQQSSGTDHDCDLKVAS